MHEWFIHTDCKFISVLINLRYSKLVLRSRHFDFDLFAVWSRVEVLKEQIEIYITGPYQ